MAHVQNTSPGAREDFASDVTELLQVTSRRLILVTSIVCLASYFAAAGSIPGKLSPALLFVAMFFVATSALALWLLPQQRLAAQAIWQIGLAATITLVMYVSQWPEVAFFYALLPLVAFVTVDWKAGLLAEGLVIGLAWGVAHSPWMPRMSLVYQMVIVISGAFIGLLGWATTHALLTAAQWALFYFEQARDKMEEAREQQMELKQTEEDLVQANRELARLSDRLKVMHRVAEEARQAKEEFVANVSHELRTPLNMIIGFSEMITQAPRVYGDGLPSSLLADITAIQRNSQHLARLVDDVLDLSQIEAGRMALSKEWASLREIVDSATLAVRALFESKKLYLEAEVPPDLPPILCDSTRIRQVAINLLSNAGRFTEQGGVTVKAWREGNGIIVSVTDTGPGIALEQQDKLFEPFQQLDSSIRRRHGGSGLGLSISKQFVEMHGGKMWLESEVDLGTTFYFMLPLETPLSAAAADADDAKRWFSPYYQYEPRTRRSKAPAPAVVPRFVLLENGRTIQRLFDRYAEGVEVVPVRDIENAFRELDHLPAQALIVNVPPSERTPAFLGRLADLPYETPAITCWVPGEDEATRRLGVVRYLVKPITRETLLSTLAELGEGMRSVLLVDDDPEVLQLFRRMLTSAQPGYSVLHARGGRRALSLLRQRRPDVMLLDLIMPGMDGFHVLQEKSQDPSIRDVPVVVISSRDPTGEHIVSDALTVTRGGGLSVSDLLTCIQALSQILTPSGDGRGQPERLDA